MALTLSSPAFKPGAAMPSRYTCEGEDISPPLAWDGVPAGTKSLALIVDDPDAPDPQRAEDDVGALGALQPARRDDARLPEAAPTLPACRRERSHGVNDFGHAGYGGPCPPIGRHRYFHKLYALDTRLDLAQATKAELEAAMKGHVLAQAELIGTYQKGDR